MPCYAFLREASKLNGSIVWVYGGLGSFVRPLRGPVVLDYVWVGICGSLLWICSKFGL